MQESPAHTEEPSTKPDRDLFIVGIGASAGGIKALQEFFSKVSPGSRIAYVVILHLSPDHDSKLAEILRLSTTLPVIQISGKNEVAPDNIYVISPNMHLIMEDGFITATPNMEIGDRRAPVDIFFRTLAESHGTNAACVVLSGTGANGSMGLKRIKEKGGVAFVQDPKDAEFTEMPRNSISTELVDEILPVSEIPARIVAYKNNMGKVRMPEGPSNRQELDQQAMREIFSQLRIHTGHDFSNYKRQTLLRRIERRINIRNVADFPSYAALLRTDMEEISALLKDLLISVTNFMRDKNAFEVVEEQLMPELFKNKKKEDSVRIWIAGCATGEEAYSIAILCAEQINGSIEAPKIQIFATDIDEAAVAHAREGIYTLNDLADISPERIRRFFSTEGNYFRVKPELRENILFAIHNFIKDPPFSHLDMLSCRNVLIYLNRSVQERVMETFHFALHAGGFLFLGSSESVEGSNDLFVPFSREFHIFKSRNVSSRTFSLPESVPAIHPQRYRGAAFAQELDRNTERVTYGELHQRLLEEYAPPSIVVNEDYDIVHLSINAGRFLQVSGGEPSQNLLKLVKPELRLELRSALYQSIQRQVQVRCRPIPFFIDGLEEIVNMHVRPVIRENDHARGFILVLFEKGVPEEVPVFVPSDEPVAKQLEQELVRVKSQLRSAMEQHDFHAEELKASNEELQAMNEELLSSAEELETSKEELQSINEELRTVNQQLKVKIDETSVANNNLENLINSVGISTIFLDRHLCVVFFTPTARTVFALLPADYGRPLSDITNQFQHLDIISDSETVLADLNTLEREVMTTDGRVFLMRILPYRTSENQVNGVVITFFDITGRKDAEEKLRSSEARFRNIITHTIAGISETTLDGKFIFANTRFSEITGYPSFEILDGMRIQDITYPEDLPDTIAIMEKCASTGSPGVLEKRYLRKNGSAVWVLDNVSLIRNAAGRPRNLIIVTLDIHERKMSEEALNHSEERFRQLSENGLLSIAFFSNDGIVTEANDAFLRITGFSRREMQEGAIQWDVLTPPEWIFRTHEAMEELNQTGRVLPYEKECFRKDGTRFWGLWGGAKFSDKEGSVSFVLDITGIKAIERQKDVFIGIASHELKTPVTSIKGYAELLKEILADSGDMESFKLANKLDGQVGRLTKLVQSLLDTTKIAEGHLVLQYSRFDLNNLIKEQVEEIEHISPNHSIEMELARFEPVYADRERIAQVLTNIISNAIKYSPVGKKILITSSILSNRVRVGVRDFGIGMTIETQARVFDRFYRESNKEIEVVPGIGLGLFIASEIVKQHGGTIGVESTPGMGSLFFFDLPYGSK